MLDAASALERRAIPDEDSVIRSRERNHKLTGIKNIKGRF